MGLRGEPFKKLGGLLKSVAPTLLTAFGGPAGALAGAVAKKAFGQTDDTMTDEALVEAITGAASSSDGLIKLREIEADLKKLEAENQFRFAELDVEDRASARGLAVATTIWPQVGLSVLFIGGYFTILGLFFAQELRIPMNEAFMVMLGVLTAGVPQVLNFWLGSSHGSQVKTSMMDASGAKG